MNSSRTRIVYSSTMNYPISDLLACSFDHWFPIMKKETILSVIIPLPADVLEYLRSGGTVVSSCLHDGQHDDADDDDDESVDWDVSDSPEMQRPRFDEFERLVTAGLQQLGGRVFVKLNWHAPLDVRWLSTGNSLQCTTVDDIHLLLRGSGRLHMDLSAPFQHCSPVAEVSDVEPARVLVLRRWTDINPGSEFRCFVRNRRLIGVSQREISHNFTHLSDDENKIVTDITSFFNDKMSPKFPLDNYMMDVYRTDAGRVRLVDVGPLGAPWDPLLFTWPQLLGQSCMACEAAPAAPAGSDVVSPAALCSACAVDRPLPVLQYIAASDGIHRAPYSSCALPYDVVSMVAGASPADSAALIEMLRKSQLSKVDVSTDEDSEGSIAADDD